MTDQHSSENPDIQPESWAERVERLEYPKWRVGFFVYVDVNANDEGEAATVAHCATRWPMNIRFDDPVPVDGWLNGHHVTGKIVLATSLMTKRV